MSVVIDSRPADFFSIKVANRENVPPRPDGRLPSVRGGRPRLAGVELLENETLPAPALPPAASAVVAKAANRRRDVRTRVNLSACVRHEESEEVVECANLSKRGFGFRSRKQYPIGCEIDVAVPFYVGTPPAFVRGSVRHVTVLPGNSFQYGVMYVNRAAGHSHEIERDQRGH